MSVYNEFVIFLRLFFFSHRGLEVMNDTAIHCIIQQAPRAQCSCSREHQLRKKGQDQAFMLRVTMLQMLENLEFLLAKNDLTNKQELQ